MNLDEKPLTLSELCGYLQAAKSTIDQYNREGLPRFYVGKECRYIPSKGALTCVFKCGSLFI